MSQTNQQIADQFLTKTIGIANLPNQLHRLIYHQGRRFNILLVGESGLGKTTFINSLFHSNVLEKKQLEARFDALATGTHRPLPTKPQIEITQAKIEEKGFPVLLTLVDTPGFGDGISNTEGAQSIVKFIDDQFESYMRQEASPNRGLYQPVSSLKTFENDENTRENNGYRKPIVDMRVHACLYFIPPHNKSLRRLDIEAMQILGQRVNLIPVIAKSDSLTRKSLRELKQHVREMIEKYEIQVFSCDGIDELLEENQNLEPIDSSAEGNKKAAVSAEEQKRNAELDAAMPFAVVSSTEEVTNSQGQRVLGRQYPWGIVEVENDDHSDFRKLRSLLIRTHMYDLILSTEKIRYQAYRDSRLKEGVVDYKHASTINENGEQELKPISQVDPEAHEKFQQQLKNSEQLFRERLAEKVKQQDARFKKWEERLIADRERLMHNLEQEHASLVQLAKEVEKLESRNSKGSSVERIVV